MPTSSSLPIISLAPFLSASATPEDIQCTLSALSSACPTHGFFYLTNHGIPASRLNQILSLERTFFLTAPPAEKSSLARCQPDAARGYQTIGENVTQGKRDAHEAVDLYREWDDGYDDSQKPKDGILSGTNIWPRTPARIGERDEGVH